MMGDLQVAASETARRQRFEGARQIASAHLRLMKAIAWAAGALFVVLVVTGIAGLVAQVPGGDLDGQVRGALQPLAALTGSILSALAGTHRMISVRPLAILIVELETTFQEYLAGSAEFARVDAVIKALRE